MTKFPSIQTRVAGVSFENRDGSLRQTYVRRVKKGDRVLLRREPENLYDPYALAVDWLDADGQSCQLGYVPRGLALVLAPLADGGAHLSAAVARKGGGGLKLAGVRITIEVEAPDMPQEQATGLEPAIARALADDGPDPFFGPDLAPALGGDRAR